MNAKLFYPLVLLAAGWLPCDLFLRADEPKPNDAVELLEPELKEARVRLADEIDKSLEAKGFLDLVTTNLIAGNPLGIDVAVPDAALQAQLGLIKDQGVVVTAVPEESQGAKAGLKVHDLLLTIDGQGVSSAEELKKLLEAANGKQVQLMLRRGGKVVELKTTPKKQELAQLVLENIAVSSADLERIHADRYRIGVSLSEADDTLRAQLGLAAGEGLVVTELHEGTAAAEAGIGKHDVLVMLDGKRLATVDAINAQIQEIKDKPVELRLVRGGKELTLRITPRKSQGGAIGGRFQIWDTETCAKCHQSAPQLADPHNLMGWKLGVGSSVWTDGYHSKLFLYDKGFANPLTQAQWKTGTSASSGDAQEQVQSLKAQLADMQKTLAALESAIQKPEDGKEEKRDEKRD
jgi:hypothetical protein